MSLVGTRPILPDELEQYELHHRARIAIKPGITGMWQVSGRSDITDFEEIVRLDTEYISEWNIGLDLVEYKNANVPGAAKPDAFRPEKDIILNKVAEKYFDTLHCLYLLGKNKPKKYIYVLEYPNGNSTSRLMIRNLLQKKLPFRLQTQLSAGKVRLIDEVKVVNIEEWNADPELHYMLICVKRKQRK